MAVPVQSFPVSPPPTMTTFLPFTSTYFLSLKPESSRLFVFLVRKSTAKYMPFVSFLPGTFISLGFSAPQQSMTASKELSISAAGMVFPTSAFLTNLMPSDSIRRILLSTISFSSFIFGMPYIRSPPTRSFFSYTVTL